MKLNILIIIAFGLILTSCLNTKQATYFANANDTIINSGNVDIEPIIQKNDILSINISSLNAEASAIFNAPNILATTTSTSTGSTEAGGYLVNTDGNIQLPILGSMKAAGQSKKQLKNEITNLILSKKLLIDPIVTNGIILPLSVFHNKWINKIVSKIKIPIAPISLGVFFFVSWLAFKIVLYFLPAGKNNNYYESAGEIFEFLTAYVFFLIGIYFFKMRKENIMGIDIKDYLTQSKVINSALD